MLYSDEHAAILSAIDAAIAANPNDDLLKRSRAEFVQDMYATGRRDNRPFHLGGCSCPPGACRRGSSF